MTSRISFESTNKKALEKAKTRLLFGGTLVALAFLVIAVRLVDVTILNEENLKNTIKTRNVTAGIQMSRADIIDRNGILLATNLRTPGLYADPKEIIDPERAARSIVKILPGLSETKLIKQLSAKNKDFVWLKREITPRQEYEVNKLGIMGIDFRYEEKRYWPMRDLTVHAVGYTNVDNKGLAGIELFCDDILKENRGPLQLSLDVRVQQVLRREMKEQIIKYNALGGSGIVLDVETGETISLVSLPDFMPHEAGTASDNEKFNKATHGIYELGSIFKIFNTAIALESGKVSLDTSYDARKPIYISRYIIRDYHAQNKILTVPEIFVHSSNIGSALIAAEFDRSLQKRFFTDLGLLRPSSIELAAKGTPRPPDNWKKIYRMTVSYGHGISVSPLHAATAVAAIVNGNHYQATLLKKDNKLVHGTKVISKKTSLIMRKLLREVVLKTSGRSADATDYLVGGKTGTADKSQGGGYDRSKLISSFVGVFPINSPKYVVIVNIDDPKQINKLRPTGGRVAAPVVGRVISEIAPLLEVFPIKAHPPDTEGVWLRNQIKPSSRKQRIAVN